MFRRVIFILSVWMFCQALTPQQGGESRGESDRAGTPEYQVQSYSTFREIRVVDSDGQLVQGLTRDEFLVKESGQARPIQYFEELTLAPISLGVLLDIGSSSNKEQILVAKAALFELLHQLDPTDELLIGVYDEDIHFLSDLTNDRSDLLRAIENVSPGGRISFFAKLAHAFASSAHTSQAPQITGFTPFDDLRPIMRSFEGLGSGIFFRRLTSRVVSFSPSCAPLGLDRLWVSFPGVKTPGYYPAPLRGWCQ